MRVRLFLQFMVAVWLALALTACLTTEPAPTPIPTPVPPALPTSTLLPPSPTVAAPPSATPEPPSPTTIPPAPPTDTAPPPTATAPPPPPTDTATAPPTDTPPPPATATPRPTVPPRPTATATVKARPTLTPRPSTTTPTTPAPAGRYVFPVQPVSAVLHYEAYHHDYPATDIFCPIGSRFVAVTNGVVNYVSTVDRWDPSVDDPATRGGLSVAIIGDDGIRYYGAHLSKVEPGIAPGVRVTAGQLLGLTGKTGDARYVDPHLHFGISRPTYPTDWAVRRGQVLPYPYLRAWATGKQLKPQLPP